MAKPAGGSWIRTVGSPARCSTVNVVAGWRRRLGCVPEDQAELVALDSQHRRDGGPCRDGVRLVGVEDDERFLIEEEPRPAHERAHPLAADAARMAEVHAVTGDAVKHLRAAAQGEQLLAQRGERGEGAVQVRLAR